VTATLYCVDGTKMEFAYQEGYGCFVCEQGGIYSLRPEPWGGIWVAIMAKNLSSRPFWMRCEDIKPIKIVFSDGAEYLFPAEEA
jgi:hypothetical protein